MQEDRQTVWFSVEGAWVRQGDSEIPPGMFENGLTLGLSLALGLTAEEINAKVQEVLRVLYNQKLPAFTQVPVKQPKKRKPKPYYRTGRY